ncbi:MAG: TIGR02147 family protein [Bdellovibrionales bacterium]|nr:TIGR02147 family protein [Bdellovibrionales bacterium]
MWPMIYEHENYRGYLKAVFAEKCNLNPSYSLRAFAGHIKISPSMLSDVLKGKKHLSGDMALSISQKLNLKTKEKDYFYNLVLLETAKNFDLKAILEKKINRLRPKKTITQMELEVFRVISDPAHVTLLEMAAIKNIKLTLSLAAAAAGVTEFEAETIFDRLMRLNLVIKNDLGHYEKTCEEIIVTSHDSNTALRSFHTKMLEKATLALENQTNDEKFVGSETIAFSSEKLE